MAFDNVPFPINPSSLHAKVAWLNIVIESRDGQEDRTGLWQDSLRSYDMSTTNMLLSNYVLLENHFNGRKGQERVFPFLDYYNSTATDENFGTGDGATLAFQLSINDGDTEGPYQRKIFKPISAIVVKDNGVTKTVTTDYTVDYTTGIVTFVVAPVAAHALTWTGTFYVPVRYTIDDLDPDLIVWSDTGQQIVQGPTVSMVEVRDIN